MKRVVIESPFAGDVELNLRYLRACMHHCLKSGEAPYASHALYTQPGVRAPSGSIDCGATSGTRSVPCSPACRPVEYRTLPGWV